jgi:hypothetical protein
MIFYGIGFCIMMRVITGSLAFTYYAIKVDRTFSHIWLGLTLTCVIGLIRGVTNERLSIVFNSINSLILIIGAFSISMYTEINEIYLSTAVIICINY